MPFRWSGDRLAAAWSYLSPYFYLRAITLSNTHHASSPCTLASFTHPPPRSPPSPSPVLLLAPSHFRSFLVATLPFYYSHSSLSSHFLIIFRHEAPIVLCYPTRISPYLVFICPDRPYCLFSIVTTPSYFLILVRCDPPIFLFFTRWGPPIYYSHWSRPSHRLFIISRDPPVFFIFI